MELEESPGSLFVAYAKVRGFVAGMLGTFLRNAA